MDIQQILTLLKQELGRIEAAIAALSGSSHRGRGRPRKSSPAGQRGPRRMSDAARAKIAAAQRARWAKQKSAAKPKNAQAAQKRPAARKPMSAAARKKLSALMKAKWADRKKAV